MIWPWNKSRRAEQPPERRNYTDKITAALEGAVVLPASTPRGLLAVRAAAGAWASAFAALQPSPPGMVSRAMLRTVGSDLILYGRTVWRVTADGFERAAIAEAVAGGWQLGIARPEGVETIRALDSEVWFHVWEAPLMRPWDGRPPWFGIGADMAAALETALRDEMGGPVGQALFTSSRGNNPFGGPLPNSRTQRSMAETIAGGTDPFTEAEPGGIDTDGLKRALTGPGRGGLAVVPMIDNLQATMERVGPAPTQPLAEIRRDAGSDVLAACGIPPALIGAAASGGGALREAWRVFYFSAVQPRATLVAESLSEALGQTITFDGSDLAAADIASRARAYAALVKAGMDTQQAARMAGLAEGE